MSLTRWFGAGTRQRVGDNAFHLERQSAPVVRVLTHVFVGEIAADDDSFGRAVADRDLDLDAAFMRRKIDRGSEDSVFRGRAGVEFRASQMRDQGGFFGGVQLKHAA